MEDRTPAAVRQSPEYSALINKPLRVFKREAVAESIHLKAKDGSYHVAFGQYAIDGAKGPNLMCIEYPFIKLKLEGEGVSVSGKKAEIFIVVPCKTNVKNTDMISDIEIPLEDLYRRPAQEGHFQSNESTDIYLRNIFGSWPKEWQLESIQFLRDKNDIDINSEEQISNKEILKKRGEPLMMHLRR